MTTIEIPVPDGTAEAYVAGPDDGSAPGVLFFMDAYGLRPQIADMLDRIAGWGYTVDFPVERFMRDAKITQIYEGTNQIQRVVMSRALLK